MLPGAPPLFPISAGLTIVLAGSFVAVGMGIGGVWPPATVLVIVGVLLLTHLLTRRPVALALAPRRPTVTSDTLALATCIRALPDPVVLLDRRGVVRIANAVAEATVPGIRTGEPVGFVLRQPDLAEAIRQVAAGGLARPVSHHQHALVDRDYEIHVLPVREEGEALPGHMLLVMKDLTEQQRLDRMRADFVANASHELRTPLASLSGFIETLQGPARDDPKARDRFLEVMRQQATRMGRLINDLLSLSRAEMNAHRQPTETVDVSRLIAQVVDALTPLARERNVEVAFARPSTPVEVRGDRDELHRVFENLIENALKYGGSGGRVDISLSVEPSPAGDLARIEVRDYGAGIAPEHLPRLTERFYRVDAGASREQGGTGLGLALVKHILARHRSRLVITSQTGQGACFSLSLPVVAKK